MSDPHTDDPSAEKSISEVRGLCETLLDLSNRAYYESSERGESLAAMAPAERPEADTPE